MPRGGAQPARVARRLSLALILALVVGVGGVAAQTAPVNLAFATLDTGSAWYVYGATMAELLRKSLPPGSNIDVKPRAGGVGNPRLVAKNETPLGFGFTVTNRWAYEGKEAYTEKLENIRALVGGLDTYYLVAVASKKLGIGSVREIRDKKLPVKIYTQPVGALGEFAGRQLLRGIGTSYTDIKALGGSTTHVGYNVIVDAFKDGRADVLFAVVTPKHPSVSEIANDGNVVFLGLDAETTKTLLPLGYVQATMPANTFKGQTDPVATVGFPTVLITNKELPEAVAYTVTRTVLDNKEALVRGHAGLAEFDPRSAWQPDKVGIPLHPGAEKAYREKGWMK
jgi:TRAP transporter TAXI family solute receptor